MTTKEIKTDLFKKLDSLQRNRLEEAYGILINYLNGKSEIEDWQGLTQEQQVALKQGIEQLNRGEGRGHDAVMSDIRNKFANE